MFDEKRHDDLLGFVLERCKAGGATDADAIVSESETQSVRVRLGDVDRAKRARSRRLGVRVFVGGRSAVASTNDLDREALETLVRETCAYAKVTAEDPFAGLPDVESTEATAPEALPELPSADERALTLGPEEGAALARAAEEAARAADPRICNSEGAELSWYAGRASLANTHGFSGSYSRSMFSLWTEPVAEDGDGKEVDYWSESRVRFADLPSPESVGKRAAERALRRLGARKLGTQAMPVVFEPTVAGRLIGQLASAINGGAVYRKSSFLAGRLGERVAAEALTIIDDPLLPYGLSSRPFDGEGLVSRRNTLVREGVLESYLLDVYTARKLGLQSTASAARSAGSSPSPAASNLIVQAGPDSPEAIISELDRGLIVTSLLGFGVNLVTGDFSQGATGLLVENGVIQHAVSEVTIAGNLDSMLRGILRVGDDVDIHHLPAAPTLLIDGMTIAGH